MTIQDETDSGFCDTRLSLDTYPSWRMIAWDVSGSERGIFPRHMQSDSLEDTIMLQHACTRVPFRNTFPIESLLKILTVYITAPSFS
jgi:hypothetical protein